MKHVNELENDFRCVISNVRLHEICGTKDVSLFIRLTNNVIILLMWFVCVFTEMLKGSHLMMISTLGEVDQLDLYWIKLLKMKI